MNLKLTRHLFEEDGIFGELRDKNGALVAYTLEHAYPGPGRPAWAAKIPPGKFICRRGSHRLAGMASDFETFEITGVPDHTGLLFHCGNVNDDSEGCVLLGESEWMDGETRRITGSKNAFARFLAFEKGEQSFELEVVLGIPSAAGAESEDPPGEPDSGVDGEDEPSEDDAQQA